MAGWHNRWNGHQLGQTPGDGEGQGGQVCCSPWGREELDRTGRLNNSNFQGTLTNTGMLFCSLSKLRTIYTGPFLPFLFLPTFYHPQPPLSPAQGGSFFVSVSSVSGKPSSYRTCFIHFSCSASFFLVPVSQAFCSMKARTDSFYSFLCFLFFLCIFPLKQ